MPYPLSFDRGEGRHQDPHSTGDKEKQTRPAPLSKSPAYVTESVSQHGCFAGPDRKTAITHGKKINVPMARSEPRPQDRHGLHRIATKPTISFLPPLASRMRIPSLTFILITFPKRILNLLSILSAQSFCIRYTGLSYAIILNAQASRSLSLKELSLVHSLEDIN